MERCSYPLSPTMSSIASDHRPDHAMTGAEDIATTSTKDAPSLPNTTSAPKPSVPSMQTPGHPSFRRCVIVPPLFLRSTRSRWRGRRECGKGESEENRGQVSFQTRNWLTSKWDNTGNGRRVLVRYGFYLFISSISRFSFMHGVKILFCSRSNAGR